MHTAASTMGGSGALRLMKRMEVLSFIVLVSLISTYVHCQSANIADFISIDCGATANYTDPITGIWYTTDDQFIDSGVKHKIAGLSSIPSKQLSTVRSFPNGTRNCYNVPVAQFRRYLVRTIFMYGNYDGLNRATAARPLLFDLHLGVNLWNTVNITDATQPTTVEAIAVAATNSMSVCLIDKGSGTPFISALELRPLEDYMYPQANTALYLVLFTRINVGPTTTDILRYPDDPYDRSWRPYSGSPGTWTEISTTSTVANYDKDPFGAPTAVMSTAATAANSSKMEFYWDFVPGDAPVNSFFVNLHFSEFSPNVSRVFNIYLNDEVWQADYTPPYLMSGYVYNPKPLNPSASYQWALNATPVSNLPPVLNAVEVYTGMDLVELPTDAGDADAITAIMVEYHMKAGWMGDPCAPRIYSWDELNCSYTSDPPRIISVNLSSMALTGTVSVSFAKLTALQYLDLSYNNLTGAIPAVLADLPSLKLLDLSNNQLNGSIPSAILAKSGLSLRVGGNPNLLCNGAVCESTPISPPHPKHITTLIIVVICVATVLVLLAVLLFILHKIRKHPVPSVPTPMPIPVMNNQQFTYKDLEKITKNFGRVIGKGGFGTVYHGCLQDGTQVAVKVQSQQSSQGTKEFLAEAENLTRVHHKNLVSLVGYCMDGDYLALVYQYMPQGTLEDHLRGKIQSNIALSWRQRLNVALEAAQGLEYLHVGCQPPLVHRDLKTANILLSENLEAKIADFGLSKPFENNVPMVPSAVVGTQGYLDPEYYSGNQLSVKSDVYSFGVILLELVTGHSPIIRDKEGVHIVQWVRQRLSNWSIEDIVDPKLKRDYNVNSVWCITDVALKCTSMSSQQRPTMANVVAQLKESLALENNTGYQYSGTFNSFPGSNAAGVSGIGGPAPR